MVRLLDRLFVFAASLKLAVGVLGALAAFLAVATLYEARYGMEAAASRMYGSGLFLGLMAVLAVNVMAAALIRYPWKRKQTGFVVTHAGILVLLAGCLVSHRTAVDGRVRLRPGDSASDAALLTELIQVNVGGRAYHLPGSFWAEAGYPSAWRAIWPLAWPLPDGRHASRRFTLGDRVEVHVAGWLPAARPQTGGGFVPADVEPSRLHLAERAVKLVVTVDGVRREAWLRRGDLPTGVDTPRGVMLLAYGYQGHDLPFNLTLVDAFRTDYPGTSRAAAFEAELAIRRRDGGVAHHTLTLNRPVTVGGWWTGYTLYLGRFEAEGGPSGAEGGPSGAEGGRSGAEGGRSGAAATPAAEGGWPAGTRQRGSVELLVRYDPGTVLKYGGSGLIALGVFLMFYMRAYFVKPRVMREGEAVAGELRDDAVTGGGGGRTTPALVRKAMVGLLVSVLSWLAMPGASKATTAPVGPPAMSAASGEAEDGRLPPTTAVLDGGRVKPLDTLARETVRAVTGRERFEGRPALEVFLSWRAERATWETRALILVPGPELKERLGPAVVDGRVSPAALRAASWVADEAASAAEVRRRAAQHGERVELTWLQSGAELLAERLARFDAVASGAAIVRVPEVDGATAGRLRRELAYHAVEPFRWTLAVYLASLMSLALSGVVWRRGLYVAGVCLLGVGVLASSVAFAWRCSITGWAPVTNLYETVVWVALVAAGLALAFELRSFGRGRWTRAGRRAARAGGVWQGGAFYPALAGSVAATLSSVVGAVMPPEMGSAVTTLVPVLQSNLYLTVHVLTIVSAYAAFAVALVLGNALLIRWAWGGRSRTGGPLAWAGLSEAERVVLRQLVGALHVGVLLMLVGTVLGGVWADVSWGRFWGWDPKEVWALVVLLTYLAVLHGRYAGWVGPHGLALGAVLAFATVVMSWYGVNFLLGAGLHTYGFGEGGQGYVLSAVAGQLVLAGACWVRMRRRSATLVERAEEGTLTPRDKPAKWSGEESARAVRPGW